MSKMEHRICSECEHWKRISVDYGERSEGDCGDCSKHSGEIMYGDDIACDMFKASKKSGNRKRQ